MDEERDTSFAVGASEDGQVILDVNDPDLDEVSRFAMSTEAADELGWALINASFDIQRRGEHT